MEADREALCGAKGRHQIERPAWRGGSVDSQVTLGGRQVEVPRVRVRSAEGEVPLASFQWAASTDPLDEHTLAAVAAGVSTRRYAGTLDPVPAEVNEQATSSSAVSRRFVALSTKRLHGFLSRPLGELDLRVVCIDGKVFRDHCMVIALGIDTQGRKHLLGLREGATETAAVTTGLLSDLVTRGLPTDRTLLFVVDGAAGLRRAITDVFGSRGVVQRLPSAVWGLGSNGTESTVERLDPDLLVVRRHRAPSTRTRERDPYAPGPRRGLNAGRSPRPGRIQTRARWPEPTDPARLGRLSPRRRS